MMQGEIYPYSLYLQRHMAQYNVQFFCQDVVCQYWPCMKKVLNARPDDDPIHDLTSQKPFLSVMHSKAHSWACQVEA